jgi:hypothetical protein
MQNVSNLWNEFTAWLSLQRDLLQTQPSALGHEFMAQLWDFSSWLNSGNRGLVIALILLVLIVDRILKRQH